LHKPREKEKGISERGKNNARMGRVKEKKKEGRNRNGEEADSARGNRNHNRRGIERQIIKNWKREKHREETECKMKHGCKGPK
jgi:hypothetical protein